MILYPHTKAINTDIERNGIAATYNGSLSICVAGATQDDKDDKPYKGSFTNKPNGLKHNGNKPNGTVNEVSASEPQNSTGQSYRNNRGKPSQNNQSNYRQDNNKDYHIQTGTSNKKFCSSCGQNNHKNSDGCRLPRDDFGRIIQQGATSGYCEPCYKKFGKQLLHPENLCPARPAMMKLYKEKKCYPSGVYKKAYEDWLANQPDHNTNPSSGRVNMIQLTHNTGKASILAVDTTGLEAHYLTRKVYLTVGVARANLPGEYQ
ncbi:MAG: hypothetical protein GY696_16590, partial [Gammaproteobacteria bacterium]|nr:hypothetical protein [Gammaproteobacteria bacterium]